MIGANREVDKDWAEFESYATNLYARSIVNNQSLLPSKLGSEQQSSLDMTNNSVQLLSNTGHLDAKAITDEMISIRKAILDLRTCSEEVRLDISDEIILILCVIFFKMNRCMQWVMDAMERVKMSKEPKPRLKSAISTTG